MKNFSFIRRQLSRKRIVYLFLLPLFYFIYFLFPPPFTALFFFLAVLVSFFFDLYLQRMIQEGGERAKERENEGDDPSSSVQKTKSSVIPQIHMQPHNSYLDKIAKKSTQLYLLFQEEDMEIIRQDIDENKRFILQGGEEWSGFEFIYILEGEMMYLKKDRLLRTGDFITTRDLKGQFFFKTVTPVRLLYFTKPSVFQSQSHIMANLLSLTKKAEKKDQQTESHCERLQDLAMRMGEELKIEETSFFPLIYAAYLHDIGKLYVPDEILKKKGALSNAEWRVIQKHPAWGRELILEKMTGFYVEKTARIVHQHHERYDGKGYPQGLKGDEIDMEAQIVSIVDSYDAITSDRPYKEALPVQQAIEEIKKASGVQFHPQVVAVFLQVIGEYERNRDPV